MKAGICAIIVVLLVCGSFTVPSSAQDMQWWDDTYNFRIPLLDDDGEEIVDFDSLIEELGLYDLGVPEIGFADMVDIDSLRVVSSQNGGVSEESFEWVPLAPVFVEDFGSGLLKWSIGTNIDTSISEKNDSEALRFSKSTDSTVKLYTYMDSETLAQSNYLSFYGSGNFRIALRDSAKGTFLLNESINLIGYEYFALPLNFDTFRDGIQYNLELYPSDYTTYNWIDEITLIDERIGIAYSPDSIDPYLYFNTFLTANDTRSVAPSYGIDAISGIEAHGAEGFRIAIDSPIGPNVTGDVKLQVRILDARNDIEWVRYRIDWPSWVEFDQNQYGIWGDFIPVGEVWMATWDSVATMADGHHTIAVMAKDVEGVISLQTMDVEVKNIFEDTNLSENIDTFSFAVIGDTQSDAGGGVPNPFVATTIMQDVAGDDIDFAIQVGDLTYSGHKIEFEQVRRQLTSYINVPMYAVAGNHDAAASDGLENFAYDYGYLYYSFDYGNSHFIFLCSELDGQKGMITGDQLTWLEAELTDNADKEHIFITVHQPIYPYYHGLENQEEVQQLLGEYDNITAIFQGHEHTYFHEMIGNMHNFVTGGATWLDPQYPIENTFNHYFIITVDGDKMTWETVVPSYLSVDLPAQGTEVIDSDIELSGYTQPYTDVTINGINVTSNVRGYYAADVPLEYGDNVISVEATGLPDGIPYSETIHVMRLSPLVIDHEQEGSVISVTVTSLGIPVQGVIVSLDEMQMTTGSDGKAIFDLYMDADILKVSAVAPGYVSSIGYIEPVPESSTNIYVIVAVVIVVILMGAIYVFKKK